MSSAYENITLILTLNNAAAQINRYFSLFIFFFGILGNVINVLVLGQSIFRADTCALFFLVSSIANTISILAGLTNRMLSGWTVDLTNTITWICIFRSFVAWVSRTFSMWIIALASFDRWLLTSTNIYRRQLSTLKNAYRGIIITFILSAFVFIQLFFCLDANILNAPSKCYGKTPTCRFIIDFTYALIIHAIPIFFMFLFGIMTIFNIHSSRQRIQPQRTFASTAINYQLRRSKKINRHLLIILIMQVIVLLIFTMPGAIQRLYSTFTLNHDKSPLQIAIENLIYNIVALLTSLATGSPFYIFTLCGGNLYRTAVRDLLSGIIRKIIF